MKLAFIRKFPKYALNLLVIVGATVGFAIWWLFRSPEKREEAQAVAKQVEQTKSDNSAKAEAKIDRLLLVDNDLYDIESGELLFKNWLKDGPPNRLFWQASTKRILAQYDRGFVRCRIDGTEEARLVRNYPMAFADDLKSVLFVKDQDIWKADIDWTAMKLAGERQVTSIHQFMEPHFAASILFGNEKAIVVRNMNRVLRIVLDTGEVKPAKFPAVNFPKQRSPDGRWLVGVNGNQFFCYDVESDGAKTLPIGRSGISDYLWIDDERCAVINGGGSVKIYERAKHSFDDVVALPFPCRKIELRSPTARFFFCTGNGRRILVDLEKRTAIGVTGGQGVTWVNHDTFFFSRELPDSLLRGTWAHAAGNIERRVALEPLMVGPGGHALIVPVGRNVVVCGTRKGFSIMTLNKESPTAVISRHPPTRFTPMIESNN